MADLDPLLAAWLRRSVDAIGANEEAAWAAAVPGPDLAAVMARLSTVPRPFLDEGLDVRALAHDVGITERLACLDHVADERARRAAAIGLWLIASETLLEPFSPRLRDGNPARMVDALALRVAPVAPPGTWLADAERREEAARLALLWCGYLPAGESLTVASAASSSLDSLARNAVLLRAAQEERHRADIARKLADAAAREAAARYTRE